MGVLGIIEEGFVGFVLPGMASAIIRVFGFPKRSNLVGVFDASGYSAAAARWKISMRVCFAEIYVSLETARRVRDLTVQELKEAWVDEPKEGWATALEGIDRRKTKLGGGVVEPNQESS